jgi:hypothetical protein
MKLCAARYVYRKLDQITPSTANKRTKVTWREWWEKRFKDDYIKYTTSMRKK